MPLVGKVVPDIKEIIDYLRNHPDFFVKHPELLTSLSIPHISDNNISSLIEYQVARLRAQIADLQVSRNRLQQGSDINRKFAADIHYLSLQLLSATDQNELFSYLEKGLKNLCSAERIMLLVFTNTSMKSSFADLRFLNTSSSLKFMFTELFHRNKPLCGSLQEEHIKALFDKDAGSIRSTLLLPMNHKNWQGLLILGSVKENFYGLGFDLDMLVYIREITLLCIQNFFKSGNK